LPAAAACCCCWRCCCARASSRDACIARAMLLSQSSGSCAGRGRQRAGLGQVRPAASLATTTRRPQAHQRGRRRAGRAHARTSSSAPHHAPPVNQEVCGVRSAHQRLKRRLASHHGHVRGHPAKGRG
jgi:hypothetical protein